MTKPLALIYAIFCMLLMSATAISISYSGWLAALFFLLTLVFIVVGFIISAKMRRRRQG
ncbi:hypothetical protein [Paenibacillus sp. R14(2021)]|uniref:hypothetical protein n=1 Tax=Paenibacillus sp. R14(2021) TaxID=2859228 RepID=UPI001C612724|nr:hypothetical protein [Paenibacillus sp. R14(2021)]